MTAVWLRLRIEARSHWRSWLGVALLVGVVSGAAIAAFAGARRTQTAYDRFLRGTRAFDIVVTNGSTPETLNRQFDFDEIARLPEVADAVKLSGYGVAGTSPSGKPITVNDLTPFTDPEGRFGNELNGVRVLHGRMPTHPDEMAVTFAGADRLGLRVGQTLDLALSGPAALATGALRRRPFALSVSSQCKEDSHRSRLGFRLSRSWHRRSRGHIRTHGKCSRCGCATGRAASPRSIGSSTDSPQSARS